MSASRSRLPGAAILDLDGTLVDTVETRVEAWARTFAEEGIPADRTVIAELIGSDGRRLARDVGRVAGVPVDDARAERIDARSGALYSLLNTQPRPLPGAVDFIAALDAAGIPWAIGTSSRREQVAPSVAALDLPAPPTIIDGTAVQRAKPDPDLLLAAADALGRRPAECWCIGDSVWDMLAAKAAGMTAVAVLAGSAVSEERLRAASADMVVPTLADLVPTASGPVGELPVRALPSR